jgi:hypothetical protein
MAIQDKWVVVAANPNESYDFTQEKTVSRPTVTLARLQTLPGPNNTTTRIPSAQIVIDCPAEELGNFKPGSEVTVSIDATAAKAARPQNAGQAPNQGA